MVVNDVEAGSENSPQPSSLEERMAHLVGDDGAQPAESAVQPMNDQTGMLRGRSRHRLLRRQQSIGIEAVHDFDVMPIVHECLRQVLDEASIPTEVGWRVERRDHTEAQWPHHVPNPSRMRARRRRGIRRRRRYGGSHGEKSNGSRIRERR